MTLYFIVKYLLCHIEVPFSDVLTALPIIVYLVHAELHMYRSIDYVSVM